MEGDTSAHGELEGRPYGKAPATVGLGAFDLLYDLCRVPTWTEDRRWRWVNTDRFSLFNWHRMEVDTFDALAEPSLDGKQVGELFGLLSDFHLTLPYDEAEAKWLLTAYGDAFDRKPHLSTIRRREPEEIVSCGLRKVVDSRDLLRRWWAWRRDTDEFRGQGTRELACDALRAVVKTVAPMLAARNPEEFLSQPELSVSNKASLSD